MTNKKYLMSFTTGGLFFSESILIVDLFQDIKDWDQTVNEAIDKNTLQTRTTSTSKRIVREVVNRLKKLSSEEIELFHNGTTSEQKNLLWLAVCRRYDFIKEFAVEVLRERYLTLKYDLPSEEYESFYNQKSEWHEELDQMAPTSQIKLRTVLYKIMREAEIIDVNKLIMPSLLSSEFVNVVSKTDPNDLTIFPISDIDIQRLING